MSSHPETVAIIGGGIAGLSCAETLTREGCFVPIVFDTGRLRPGGRCSSRLPGDMPKDDDDESVRRFQYLNQVPVDHAAQILTVPSSGMDEFAKQVQQWEKEGIVKRFPPGTVCNISNPYDRKSKKYDKSRIRISSLMEGDNYYYGVNGMGSIPKRMSKGIEINQDVWVSPSGGVKYMDSRKQWQVRGSSNQGVLGTFDRLVVAHNGKCADRLMSRTPAKDLHSLLRVNFAPYAPRNGGTKMTLNSIYSLTFAIQGPSVLSKSLPESKFISGFLKNHPHLRFLSCNTRKHDSALLQDKNIEVWTVLSSAKFGKAHKGPQEFLPSELRDEVTELMLRALEESLVLPKGSICGNSKESEDLDDDDDGDDSPVLESRLQLWGAAVPVNIWKPDDQVGYLYDEKYGVGACGDWLLESSIAGAWESGRRLAVHMSREQPETAGLQGSFEASQTVDKVGIGALQ